MKRHEAYSVWYVKIICQQKTGKSDNVYSLQNIMNANGSNLMDHKTC